MLNRTPLAIVFTAVLAGAAGFGASQWLAQRNAPPQAAIAATPAASIAIGAKVPDITLPGLMQTEASLSDYPGQILLVNFWATWCAPCREEIPLLKAINAERDDLTVIGIALDEHDAVLQYAEQLWIDYPVMIDTPSVSDSSVVLGNERGVLPYTALIDADGRLAATKIGNFEDAADLAGWVSAGVAKGR